MPAVTIAKAAKHVTSTTGHRVPSSTIRTWCLDERFAGFLSDDANPPAGSTRYFTPHDLDVLVRIAEYRRQNLSYDEIAESLTKPAPPPVDQPIDQPAELPQTVTDERHAPIQRLDVSDTAAIIQTVSAQYEPRLAEMDKRMANIESNRLNMPAIIAAFVAGAALVAVIAMLLVMLR